MTDEPEYDPVDCPVEDCAFRDAPRAVAAHVSGTHDDLHDWDRLPHDGAREFVMAEKRAQLEAMGAEIPGGDRSDGDTSASSSSSSSASSSSSTSPSSSSSSTSPSSSSSSSSSPSGTPPASTGDSSSTTDSTSTTGADSRDGSEPTPLETTFADDAMAVLALLQRYGTADLSSLDTFRLANLYALLSDLESTAGDARTQVRDALLDLVQDDRDVPGDYGVVKRYSYERRSLKEEETVREVIERAGLDPVAVMSIDKGKVEEAVEGGWLDEDDVFDAEERASIRRVSVAEDRRDELVAGLDPDLRELLERE